jgi:hypothetical protein
MLFCGRKEMVKKLFLVFLILLTGMAGLSATPPRPGGADDAPQMIMPLADSTVSTTAPGVSAPMRPGGIFVVQGNDAAFTEAIDLICLWFDQYQEGLLAENDFKTLVAGRIAVMYMRNQAPDRGMKALAEKTRAKVDRLLLLQELKLGIR